MELKTFLQKLKTTPDSIAFGDTMAVIEASYDFSPAAFKNGVLMNEAGQNSGSCKLFAFAQLQGMSPTQTLACFGAYYRDDVLKNPAGTAWELLAPNPRAPTAIKAASPSTEARKYLDCFIRSGNLC